MPTYTPTPVLVSAPAVEPVTADELRAWVRQDTADDAEDAALRAGIVRAAREWFEAAADRQLVTATWELRLPAFTNPIDLPLPPLASVVSIKYDDEDGVEQTVDAAVYEVVTSTTPGRIYLADGETWPVTFTGQEVVRIRFTAGQDVASVPDLAKTGIKLLAAHWYANREAMDSATATAAVHALAVAVGGYRF